MAQQRFTWDFLDSIQISLQTINLNDTLDQSYGMCGFFHSPLTTFK